MSAFLDFKSQGWVDIEGSHFGNYEIKMSRRFYELYTKGKCTVGVCCAVKKNSITFQKELKLL